MLDKQDDNIQPWHTPFPILNKSVVPSLILTVASWPAYRYLTTQVRWSGTPISLRICHSCFWPTRSKAFMYLMKQKKMFFWDSLAFWKESYDKPRELIKKQRYHFANKGPHSQSYDFSSSHVWMWELDHKEGWALRNWCFWLVVLEKTLKFLGLQRGQSSQS